MRYLYMNNFRGFKNAIIPLNEINFLVGENSTGKSSFLSLLNSIEDPMFWKKSFFTMNNDQEHNSFADFVSAWSNDKSFFQVGIVNTNFKQDKKISLSYFIHEFVEHDDGAKLTKQSILRDDTYLTIFFEDKSQGYSIRKTENIFKTEQDALKAFIKSSNESRKEKMPTEQFPSWYTKFIEPSLALTLVNYNLTTKKEKIINYNFEEPRGKPVKWIAPIRNKPKRIYDGINTGYSPEGEHVPVLIRRSLRQATTSNRFAKSLQDFGEASGLFQTVVAHSFGEGPKDPFELLIQFKGAQLNIINVGYGVSQALPLIVEFLTTKTEGTFAVQQPEVHLHPRAQAALGGLIFELAKERNLAFFIETHSDYLIDRYRLSMRSDSNPPLSQILFFKRTSQGNTVDSLPISKNGLYPLKQPSEFRDFFVKEEIKLMEL